MLTENNKQTKDEEYITLRYLISLGSLLHDIGKLIQRSGEESGTHEQVGKKFFENGNFKNLFNNIKFKNKNLNYSIKDFIDASFSHHNPSNLNEASLKNIAKIYQKADHLSASERSEKKLGKPNKKKLVSIFQSINILLDKIDKGKDKEKYREYFYPLESLEINENTSLNDLEKIIFPFESEGKKSTEDYKKLKQSFEKDLKKLENEKNLYHAISKLYHILYKHTWCVPSCTWTSKDSYYHYSDISLFDHLRTTAAIAASIVTSYNLNNFKNNFNNCKFLLIEGDVSGIQKFIFDVQNISGVTKRLRGRSFFISVLPEIISRYILKELNYHPVINTLFVGAGKFQILIGYEKNIEEKLKNLEKEILKSLLKKYKGILGFVMDWVELKESDFAPQNFREKIKELSEKINEKKKRKFEKILDSFSNLVKKENIGNKKLCSSCKWELINEDGDNKVCSQCKEFEKLGFLIPKIDAIVFLSADVNLKNILKSKNIFFINLENVGKIAFLRDEDFEALNLEILREEYVDIFLINKTNFLEDKYKNIISGFKFICTTVPKIEDKEILEEFLKSYMIKNEPENIEENTILSLQYLEKFSLGNKKLGYLKADVDNLGLIFIAGFSDADYSISRVCTLSRNLDLFFTLYLDKLFKEFEFNSYSLLKNQQIPINSLSSLIYTVYSGGDDLFFIAPWNVVCECMKVVREKFKKYTCENPSFGLSAGIGVFSGTFPVRLAADITDGFEKNAKRKDFKKNKVCVFNCVLDWEDYKDILEKIYQEDNINLILGEDKIISKSMIYKFYKYIKSVKHYVKNIISNKKNKHTEEALEKIFSFFPYFYYQVSRNLDKNNSKHQQILKLLEELILENIKIEDDIFSYIDKILFALSYLLMISRDN